ncbi:KilA-N domain-containing protein [Halomonas sp. IOP_6]|uniref:KilA-N domain-containing protein n=1 Tax=Halomonas sp. IOP_6 TaxID=2876583 RepID=UPI001E4DC06C|nr:KilA-N domain-containing protein [Halomonas sp. IOP_6]MCD6005078.1 KilA-N domain-containing protein [Halomonas sp. IOP_6]
MTPRLKDSAVRIDSEGRFNINDLHKAAGGENRKRPSLWAYNQNTQELIEELKAGNPANKPIVGKPGRYAGTFVVKELVYAYAMWISPKFRLKDRTNQPNRKFRRFPELHRPDEPTGWR